MALSFADKKKRVLHESQNVLAEIPHKSHFLLFADAAEIAVVFEDFVDVGCGLAGGEPVSGGIAHIAFRAAALIAVQNEAY